MQKTILIVFGVFIAIVAIIGGVLYFTRLEVTVPSVSLMFVPSPAASESVDYSYCYEGSDLFRGDKFGGYDCSEIITTQAGEVITIPEKKIVSYWPMSSFYALSVNGSPIDIETSTCSWNVYMFSKDSGLVQEDLTPENNEFLLNEVGTNALSVSCL